MKIKVELAIVNNSQVIACIKLIREILRTGLIESKQLHDQRVNDGWTDVYLNAEQFARLAIHDRDVQAFDAPYMTYQKAEILEGNKSHFDFSNVT